jgi:hypothetical protein
MLLLVCCKIRAIRFFIASWVVAHAQEGQSIVLTDGVLIAQGFRTSCCYRIIAVWFGVEVVALAGRHCEELAVASGLLGDLRWVALSKDYDMENGSGKGCKGEICMLREGVLSSICYS